MLELWPFTNFHDLNLDWIISKLGELKRSVESAADSADSAYGYMTRSETAAGNAEASETAAAGSALAAQTAEQSMQYLEDNVASNSARITVLESGSTPDADAELLDIRVGVDSYTFDSAGDAVRGQARDIKTLLEYIAPFRPVTLGTLSPGYIASNGTITSPSGNAEVYTDNYFDFIPGNAYVLVYELPTANSQWMACGLYDEDGNWIQREQPTNIYGNRTIVGNYKEETVDGRIRYTMFLSNGNISAAKKFRLTWRGYNGAAVCKLYVVNIYSTLRVPSYTAMIQGDNQDPRPVSFDTDAKTVTIPGDSLLMVPSRWPYVNASGYSPNAYTQLSPAGTDIVLQYDNILVPGYLTPTTAVHIVYDMENDVVKGVGYADPEIMNPNMALILSVRWDRDTDELQINYPGQYEVNGNLYDIDQTFQGWRFTPAVKSINHRGYNTVAPENTLPAFKLSKQKGFDIIECDLQLTSDDVPVVLHDDTINRTARNLDGTTIGSTVYVYNTTYNTLRNSYDFGVWKSTSYAGTKIPSWRELCELARALGLKIYCEIKQESPWTQAKIDNVLNIARECGVYDNVTYISFDDSLLQYVRNTDPDVPLSYVVNTIDTTNAARAAALGAAIDADHSNLTATRIGYAKSAGCALETWTIDSGSTINGLDPYVTAVTSNSLIAAETLYNNNI